MNKKNALHPLVARSRFAWRLYRVAFSQFRDVWRDAFVTDLVFRALGVMAIAPVFGWIATRFVRSSGNEAIANFDIAEFLAQPLMAAMLVVLVGVGVGWMAIRLGALCLLLDSSGVLRATGAERPGNSSIDYVDAIRISLSRAKRLITLAIIVSVVTALILVPFGLVLVAIGWMLLTRHDINFYLDSQPKEWWLALALASVVVLACVASLARWMLPLLVAFPSTAIDNHSPTQSLAGARAKTRGRAMEAIALIFSCFAFWVGLSITGSVALHWFGRWIIPYFETRLDQLVAVLAALTFSGAVAAYLIHWFAICMACSICVAYYRELVSRDEAMKSLPRRLVAGSERSRFSPKRLAIPVAVLMAAAVSASGTLAMVEQLSVDDCVENVAHRGYSLAAPENTIPAITLAIEAGASMVELDIQRTVDGVLVVHHDADMMRTSLSSAVISQSTWQELQRLEVAGRFQSTHPGTHLATLKEAIDAARGKVRLILEVKSYRDDSERLIRDMIDMVREERVVDQVMVMSLKYSELLYVESIADEIETGFVASASLGDLTRLRVDFLAIAQGKANDVFVATAHATDKEVYVWTVDRPEQMSRMIDMGVDGIITNDPAMLVRVLRERQELSNTERLVLRFQELYKWD